METFECITATLLLYGGMFYFAHLNTFLYRKLTLLAKCISKNSRLLAIFKRRYILIYGVIFYVIDILYLILSFLMLTVVPNKSITPVCFFGGTNVFIDTRNNLLLWRIGISYLSIEIAFYMINTYKKPRPIFSHKSWILSAIFIMVYAFYTAWIVL